VWNHRGGLTVDTTAQHSPQALTAAQQQLVADHLGLVALHIRRFVSGARRGSGQRDYDDLFQEGCCGLALAARNYDPASGMSFPAYALPRIRLAISTALTEKSGLIRVPRVRRAADPAKADPRARERGPRVQALVDRPMQARPADADVDGESRTVGDRLREKYDLALAAARQVLARRKSVRADRDRVAARILSERLAIAEPEERTSLRRIAAETGSSHARVVQCERRLFAEARRALVGDLEFQGLEDACRRSVDGVDTCIDAPLAARLRGLAAVGFCRRWKALARPRQAEYTLRLVESLPGGADTALRELFCRLYVPAADALSLALAGEVPGQFLTTDG